MNTPAAASDRELKILELLSDGRSTQRDVASAVGVSLGFVNAVVRRLVKTGHLKIQNLNANRVRYILTPKGLSEKARQGVDYLNRTVRTLNECLDRIGSIVDAEVRSGRRSFVVVGEGDILNLVVVALELRKGAGVRYERREAVAAGRATEDVCVLDCREPGIGSVGISVLGELLASSRGGGNLPK